MIRIALLPGDGIGPEVTGEARRVLEAAAAAGLAELSFETFPHGADHFLATGETLGDEAFARLRDGFDAILLGAVGDPRVPDHRHARDILLGLRFRLDLYANLRPARLRLPELSPLRGAAERPFDVTIVRENTEGFYAGAGGVLREGTPGEVAVADGLATRVGVERIVRAAFALARREGRGRVTLADKANAVPHLFGLWRRVFRAVAAEHPEIEAEEAYVDAVAMRLVREPERFEVIVTENLLGDILSDLACELAGGIGLAPSANLNPGRHALYEPVHGSAPDLAGTGTANPVGAILSAALLLAGAGAAEAAARVEEAVDAALRGGIRTPDTGGDRSTRDVGAWIADRVRGG
ncbi:MAG: isocitrate/isopropylmalate family dehydrogenase [Gemmatimonadota bacterium]|nr:isocitrate/isopropylmalate family dehydrogenase [Gemmatimonadota bacterium]